MSALLSHRNGSVAFVQLTRLFAGLKRSGRVMDVVWFQHNPEYARAILVLADESDDNSVRQIAVTLRKLIPDFLEPTPRATGRFAAVTALDAESARARITADEETAPTGAPVQEDRYVGRLR